MRQRSPERIIKLYNWLWRRATKCKQPPFSALQPRTLTGRCLLLIIPPLMRIEKAMKSREYQDAVSKIIHSN